MHASRVFMLALATTVLLAACTPSGTSNPAAVPAGAAAPSAPKRVVAAIMGDANTLHAKVNANVGNVPGLDSLQELTNSGLSVLNTQGVLVAQLAEQVPSVENGLWTVYPDGRMETIWRIREGA